MSAADRATALLRRWIGTDNEHEAESCRKTLVDLLKKNPELTFQEPPARNIELDARFRIYQERFGGVATEHLSQVFRTQLEILVTVGQLFGAFVLPGELRLAVEKDRRMIERLTRQVADLTERLEKATGKRDAAPALASAGGAWTAPAVKVARAVGRGAGEALVEGVFGVKRRRPKGSGRKRR